MSAFFSFILKKWRRLRLYFRIFIFKKPSGADQWFWENGDETYRLDYPLNKQSLVLDLGGYKGEWAEKIYARYQSQIFIFEPVALFQNILKNKFGTNLCVTLFPFGLGGATHTDTIFLNDNGSSTHLSSGTGEEKIQIIGIDQFFKDKSLKEVDLMKINIEGEEFFLFETMLQHGLQYDIRNIQVQFHPWIEDANNRRNVIRAELSKTHRLTYDFPFVWENWQRIDT